MKNNLAINMKAILLLVMIFFLAVPVFADIDCIAEGYEGYASPGNIEDECRSAGFDFGIEKWEYVDGEWIKTEDKWGWDTTVEGDASHVEWSAYPGISGIISKEAPCYGLPDQEGLSGSYDNIRFDISHVVFCGSEGYEVPELSLYGLIAAGLVTAGLLLYLRNRNLF